LQANLAIGQNNAVTNPSAAPDSAGYNHRINFTVSDCCHNCNGQLCAVTHLAENQISVSPEQLYNNGFASRSRKLFLNLEAEGRFLPMSPVSPVWWAVCSAVDLAAH
jgi:hypothetical protein